MKLTIRDFSGGITDSPFSAPANCFETMDCILIEKDKTARTSPGVDLFDATNNRLSTNSRVSKWAQIDDGEWIAFSGKQVFHVTSSTITEVLGPTGNLPFNTGDADSIVTVTPTQNQLLCTNSDHAYPIKIWKDETDTVQLVTAGLPEPTGNPINTPNVAAGKRYLYAFVWAFEYTVGSVLHLDLSTPKYYVETAGADMNSGGIHNFTALPTLSNGADYNFDTVNVTLRVYRSKVNGSSLYWIGSNANGDTTFFDAFDDAEVGLMEPLYTNGGIQTNDMPPPAKVAFEANNTVHYLDYIDGTEEKPNRSIQAITSDFDSVPASFFTSYNSTAMGGGSIGRAAIIFTEKETVRLDGLLTETGEGSSAPTVLSATIGCISHNSVVAAPRGLYFASRNGFYFTDGVGAPVLLARKDDYTSKIDGIYRDLVLTAEQRSRIQGAYDPLNHRVYWTVQAEGPDNDRIFVYDETHDAFTTISFSSGIAPTAIILDGQDLLIGDADGYLFRMSDDYFTVPVKEVGVATSAWDEEALIYTLKTTQMDAGDGSVNKHWSSINVQGNPETNLAMAIRSYSNGEPEYKELFPLKVSPSLIWGDTDFTWGDASFTWDRSSTMNQTRRFPAGRLRARHRALEFTNAYVELASSTSDTQSRVTISGAANTATLVLPSTYSFGANNEGYDLLIDGVYYEILSGTADTLTLSDPDGTLVDGTYDWEIWGHGKGQRAHFLNFSVEFETLTGAGTHWRGSTE